MRLFVGVALDEAVRAQAAEVTAALRPRLTAVAARWVPIENLHLTVRFIGHVPDDRVTAMGLALERPLTIPTFAVEFGGCGRFPPRGAPRVLWIGLNHGLAELTALHEEFNRRVAPFGYAPETRPFAAHLTLARFKDARGGDGRTIDEALRHQATSPFAQPVERVTVFESRLSPSGPRYTPLRQIPLPRSANSDTAN